MKKRVLCWVVLLVVLWPLQAYPGSGNALGGPPSSAPESTQPFLGRWDLSLKTPNGELPSWIEISEEQDHLKVVMVGLTDHATELKKVDFKNGQIEFLSPKGEEGFSEDTLSLRRNVAPKWGAPVTLFNGKDFTGWTFNDAGARRIGRWRMARW